MVELGCPDLAADPSSVRVVKDEVVSVAFADAPGEIESAVGRNRYAAGDALITGSTGDRWSVTRERFEAKYRPCDGTRRGQPGAYRNLPQPVLAKWIGVPFRIARRPGGDVLSGSAGDWAVQYGPGDYGIVDAARFARVYRPLPDPAGRDDSPPGW
jgi:hypothetical protein